MVVPNRTISSPNQQSNQMIGMEKCDQFLKCILGSSTLTTHSTNCVLFVSYFCCLIHETWPNIIFSLYIGVVSPGRRAARAGLSRRRRHRASVFTGPYLLLTRPSVIESMHTGSVGCLTTATIIASMYLPWQARLTTNFISISLIEFGG